MGMMRFILIAAALWLLFGLARSVFRKRSKSDAATQSQTEKVVPCAHCGTYLPVSDAVRARDALFCCEDHARRSGSRQ